jgi:hypothetical protein
VTKQRQPNPQPTPGKGSVIYLAPRSKEPRLDALYEHLIDIGWRFDTVTTTWWTPVGEPEQFGRLEYVPEYTEAWIQPPSRNQIRPKPIAHFVLHHGAWGEQECCRSAP